MAKSQKNTSGSVIDIMTPHVKFLVGVSLILALMSGCGSGTATDGGILTLNLEAAIDAPRVSDVAEIADNLEFIPLNDSSANSLIGDRVMSMAESKSGWYIHDMISSPIKFFDRTGKFAGTIGSIGRGPAEALAINGMVVDYETDRVWVTGANSMIAYDANGKMTARNDSILCFTTAWFADRLLLVKEDPRRQLSITGTPQPAEDGMTVILDLYSADLQHKGEIKTRDKGTHYIVTYDSSGEQITNLKFMGSPHILSGNGKTLSLKEGRNDTVYHFLSDGTLESAFKLDLGHYTPPAKAFGTNPDVDWSRYWRVVGIWEGDRIVVVTAQKALETEFHYLVLDRQKPADGFMAVGSDGKSGLYIDGVPFTPCRIQGNRLVGYMQAFDIVDNAKGITNPDLRRVAETLEEGSNLVVVVAKLNN